MGVSYWYAYWLMFDARNPNRLIKCTRGPEEELNVLNEKVRRLWTGHYEVVQLPYRDPNRAKGIINDLFAQKQWNIPMPDGSTRQITGIHLALQKHSWKSRTAPS